MRIKFRDDEKVFSTDYSIEILDDDNKPLFDIFLSHDGLLKVYGIDRLSSKLSIEPNAANFVILKLNS